MVTPFGPTPAWIRAYIHAKREGFEEREARLRASLSCGIKGKQFARCRLSTGNLTVPVDGGADILKKKTANPVLSEHGKWRREHIGAINAAYGRTPFYAHLIAEIDAVYAGSEGITLEDFNSRLTDVVFGWFDQSALTSTGDERIEKVRKEISAKVNENLSIFDALFRLGREAVFAL